MASLRDEEETVGRLRDEVGLTREEALIYVRLLKTGTLPLSLKRKVEKLQAEGMLILSGDGKWYIPVHPRLAIANHYRTWREGIIREMNDRRMRVDRLILELIPLYEAAMEKRLAEKARGEPR